MPNIKSAKKRVEVTSLKTLRNKMAKTQLKNALKKFEAAVVAGDKTVAAAAYKNAVKKLDRAANKGLVHTNKAARKKSQFTRKLNSMGA